MIRRLTICVILALTALAVKAQYHRIHCDRGSKHATRAAAATRSGLSGTFHYPVVLVAFPDRAFDMSEEETVNRWHAMLNEEGFSEYGAKGCASEYFQNQSGGQYVPVFDILGLVVLPQEMAYYGANRVDSKGQEEAGEDKRPQEMIRDACQALNEDFSPYDHDGDGEVDIVIVLFAGAGEHLGGGSDAIWPHKWFTSGKVGSVSLGDYICLSDMNYTEPDGFATLCHEFSHYLGLPDLYPVSGSAYSFFDEWDLMDGGNYTNGGYSPPNYSAFERSLLGWITINELTEPTSISELPAWDTQPVAYKIVNPSDTREYYILENRQQKGWDYLIPGNGLLVTHVNHYSWTLFPNTSSSREVDLVAADNRSYDESMAYFAKELYDDEGRNRCLSLAAYPYQLDSVNNSLTDVSIPAMTFATKPVTNIQMDVNGLISFDFMKASTAIVEVQASTKEVVAYYDLQGNKLPAVPLKNGIFIIRFADGTTRKVVR